MEMIYQHFEVTDVKYHVKQQKKRNKFTVQEDEMLKYLVNQFGTMNWNKISKLMPSRNPKQCRDRYFNYLSEVTKNEPWTQEEDEIILNLLQFLGPKWVEISHHIPGRSGINVKNRWYKHLIKQHFHLQKNNLKNQMKPYQQGNVDNALEIKDENVNINSNSIICQDKINQTCQMYSISSLLV